MLAAASNTQDFPEMTTQQEALCLHFLKALQQNQRSECKPISIRDGTSLVSRLGLSLRARLRKAITIQELSLFTHGT